jgi:RNA polymerase sigma-70 factor (ECF subfamily)
MTRPLWFLNQAAHLPAGDPDAAAEIVRRFTRRLAALARRRLRSTLRQRIDPEDIVQSVFRSFFRRQALGRFEHLDGWDALWRLLACITVRKCARKAERALRELADEAVVAASMDRRPTPEEIACLTDIVEHLMRGLSTREQEMLWLRLQGFSSSEIGQQLGCTERKVQRLVEHLRGRLHRLQARAL